MIYLILILLGYYYGNYMNHMGYQKGVKEFTEKILKDKFGTLECKHPNQFVDEHLYKARRICFNCEKVISEYIK